MTENNPFKELLGGDDDFRAAQLLAKEKQRISQMRSNANILTDSEERRLAKCRPWTADELNPSDYLIEVSQFGDEEEQRCLSNLEKYGICHVRMSGADPSVNRMVAIENGLGPAFARQNDFEGKVKSIHPSPDVEANTGDSAKALGFHVDGTQHPRTPAILVFQYQRGAQYGGHSTFLDLCSVFSKFAFEELAEILLTLSVEDCAVFEKKKMKYVGPLVTSVSNDRAVSCRFRFDSVMNIQSDKAKAAYEKLRETVDACKPLIFKPREGDFVVFDNWRVLHGRLEVGGRHQRHHDRMWIEKLRHPHDSNFVLGVRPLGIDLIRRIKMANVGSPG